MRSALSRVSLLPLMTALAAAVGCAVFDPNPSADVPFKERAQTKREGNVRVTAAVPSAK